MISDRDFYVTVVEGRRVGYLLGPYGSHAEALANVERARGLAEKADAFATFYLFGTASRPATSPVRTVFSK